MFKGDMGHSFLWHAPVTWVIGQRIFNSLLLTSVSTVFAWIIAIPIGIHSAVNQYSWSDKLLTFVAFIGVAIPTWFFGLLLLYFTVSRGWGFPVGGMTSLDFVDFTFWEKVADLARHMFLPTLVLTTGSVAGLMRYMRSNLLDVLRQDFVTTARAKGLSKRVVIYKHAVRNAINPLITIFGYQLGSLLSGAALTEIVMNWPGIGSLMLNAVQGKDYYLVMGNLIIGSVMLILGNLVADILLAVSDPRIRYE
nr:ABC transporter permease [Bacillota bacterium]